MTAESPSKPKRGIPDYRAVWQGYAALVLALGVCIFLLIYVDAAMHFPYERGTPIVYPLLLLEQPLYAFFFWGGVSMLLMVLVVFAFRRRVRLASVVMFILVWEVVGYGSLTIYADPAVSTLYQSISHADHVYHLFYIQDTHLREETIHLYTVFKCDSLSLLCQYVSTPYVRLTTIGQSDSFNESGALFVDAIDNTLKLRVGEEVYRTYIDNWSPRP